MCSLLMSCLYKFQPNNSEILRFISETFQKKNVEISKFENWKIFDFLNFSEFEKFNSEISNVFLKTFF